jgi:3-hydroxybutyryl-CoA dehydrogenase
MICCPRSEKSACPEGLIQFPDFKAMRNLAHPKEENMIIQKVAVIGTGILGTQIAIQAACHNYEVTTHDIDDTAFGKVLERLKIRMKNSSRKPTISWPKMQKEARRVKQCKSLKEAVAEADLVIEAVPEDLSLKRKVFKQLDVLAPRKALLATNSSSIPISRIETATTRPGQCLNIHFYGLDQGRNIVDVMGGPRTPVRVIKAGKNWVHSIGCIPLTVKKEILGFCFNRVWRAIKREALHMWAGGYVNFKDIDRGWMNWTGMSQGPFGLMDGVGLDVVHDIEMVYYRESKNAKDRPPKALKRMIEKGNLGVKSGKGFYTYPDPEFRQPGFLK